MFNFPEWALKTGPIQNDRIQLDFYFSIESPFSFSDSFLTFVLDLNSEITFFIKIQQFPALLNLTKLGNIGFQQLIHGASIYSKIPYNLDPFAENLLAFSLVPGKEPEKEVSDFYNFHNMILFFAEKAGNRKS